MQLQMQQQQFVGGALGAQIYKYEDAEGLEGEEGDDMHGEHFVVGRGGAQLLKRAGQCHLIRQHEHYVDQNGNHIIDDGGDEDLEDDEDEEDNENIDDIDDDEDDEEEEEGEEERGACEEGVGSGDEDFEKVLGLNGHFLTRPPAAAGVFEADAGLPGGAERGSKGRLNAQ